MATEFGDKAVHSVNSLYLKLLKTFPTYDADFNAKWESWRQAISSSDPSTWSSVAEFNALVALGPKAVPLVLWRLVLNQEDAATVFLYNKLEHDPEHIANGADLARQVRVILEKNFKRYRLIRNALLDWAEHCEMVALMSNSWWSTDCDEFEELVRIGPPVIPQLMLQYQNRDGPLFFYELLHEILWGYKTKQQTVSMADQYNMWADWFENKNYDEAPHYSRPPP